MKGKELHNHMMVHHPAKPPKKYEGKGSRVGIGRHESESQEVHNLNYINPVDDRAGVSRKTFKVDLSRKQKTNY